jgi:hypothetical protein
MSKQLKPFIVVAMKGHLAWNFDTSYIRRIVKEASEGTERDAKALLTTPGGGRLYRKKGRYHQASSAGEMPASDTGRLARSVLARASKDGLTYWVGPSTKLGLERPFYPAFLIYGANRPKQGGTMEKRGNAIAVALRVHRRRFNRQLKKALEKGIKPGEVK